MRILNKNKTKELSIDKIDFAKGYLKDDILTTHIEAQPLVETKTHFKVVKEYPNGGKDVEEVVDIVGHPAIEEHDEIEQIQIFVPYTKQELAERQKQARIAEIKVELNNLSQDFIQAEIGAVFDDLEQRKENFKTLHNELRKLLGKEPRIYK